MTVFTIFQHLLPTLLLLAQLPVYTPNPLYAEPDLLRKERLNATYGASTNLLMITIIAQFQDGSPARGYINCNGLWFKYADEQKVQSGWNLPFKTDSRGAVVMHPSIADYSGDFADDQLTCYATSGLRSGKISFVPYTGGVFHITIPGRS